MNDFLEEFKSPGAEYRSLPFWGWNDKMSENEIRRQIREMKNAGIGGFFIHSRDGLETEYLSDEWLSLVEAAVDEAKKNGMYAWLYDEDRWPSGTCGGYITKNKNNACHGLTLEVATAMPGDMSDVLALYAAKIDGNKIKNLRRLNDSDEALKSETLLIARLEVSGASEWFNFSPPPDNLSDSTVDDFIKNTHDVYKKRLGDEFGMTIPGIFTDEPSLADRHAAFNPRRGWIPWTAGFDEYFKGFYGRDILDEIPYLYFSGEKDRKVRHDYWRLIAKRFKEKYSDKIHNWCENNNLCFTGHFLQEDKMGLSCRVSGSVMPHYAIQDVPGVDLLTERCDEYLTIKQCTSVASQLGKNMVLCEAYGCTGWDFSFEGQKWIGDWLYALGVNLRCQHIALYSLRGCRKRDYPPSINYNNSWWSEYKTVEDYFARLSYMLRRGKAVRKVLVLHPMSSVWSKIGCAPYGNPKRSKERDIPAMNEFGDKFNGFLKKLFCTHYDFDLGDEEIMSSYGNVDGSGLWVGENVYDTVLVPQSENMLKSTVTLLEKYLENGGTVIAIAPLTEYIDGEKSDKAISFFKYKNFILAKDETECYEILKENTKRTVSVKNENGDENESVLYQLRKDENGYILFLANNDRAKTQNVKIELDLDLNGYHIYNANLLSGEFDDGSLKVSLLPCESILYYITKDRINLKSENGSKLKNYSPIPIKYVLSRADRENVLTLDMCRYRLNDKLSSVMEVWQAQKEIREELGMKQIYQNGLQQRYHTINQRHENDFTPIELEFEFSVTDEVKDTYLLVERPECFEISLDGEEIANTPCGYFLDRAFEKLKLPVLKKGRHKVTMFSEYTHDMELENIYIIGDFGVNASREIVKTPKKIKLGDVTSQGYFHYIGGMDYEFLFEYLTNGRVFLKVPMYKGTAAKVIINGCEIPIPWQGMDDIEITKYLKISTNEICIKVIGSPKNMLGPLHITNRPLVTKDSCFCPMGDNYTKDYIVSEYGLYDAPILKLYTKEGIWQ